MDIILSGVSKGSYDEMMKLDSERDFVGLDEYNGFSQLYVAEDILYVLDRYVGFDYFGERFDLGDGYVRVLVAEDGLGTLTVRLVINYSGVVLDVSQEDIFAESFVNHLGLEYDGLVVDRSNMRVR